MTGTRFQLCLQALLVCNPWIQLSAGCPGMDSPQILRSDLYTKYLTYKLCPLGFKKSGGKRTVLAMAAVFCDNLLNTGKGLLLSTWISHSKSFKQGEQIPEVDHDLITMGHGSADTTILFRDSGMHSLNSNRSLET